MSDDSVGLKRKLVVMDAKIALLESEVAFLRWKMEDVLSSEGMARRAEFYEAQNRTAYILAKVPQRLAALCNE